MLATQPWRILTGHLIHINWPHALVNAAALWIVARLYAPDLNAPSQAVALFVSALAVSAALAWLTPSIEWYRGLSGALHGLFFAGAAKWLLSERPRTWQRLWLPATLFVGGWIKVWTEQPGGATTPYANWLGAAVVPQAQLAYEASIASYQAGKVPFLTVLEALSSLYADRLNQLRVVASHERVKVALDEASLGIPRHFVVRK